jgi:hypothetical protein
MVGKGSDWRRCNAQGMVVRKRVGGGTDEQ